MAETGEHRHRRRTPSPERIAAARKQHMKLLGLLVLLVFASALGGDFVWSDREDLLQGAFRIDSAGDVAAGLTRSRESFRALTLGGSVDPAVGSWQPMVLLANTLGWSVWGACAFCFHLENLLLHLAVVIGLYALGRHLLSHRRHGNRIAAWSAGIYAVHPATVSAVAWIGGQATLLAAAFSVWTLVIFTRLQATTKSRRSHVNRWLVALALTSLSAYLSYESAFVLPLLALVIAAFESSERGRGPVSGISPRRWKGLLVMSGCLVLVLAYRKLALGGIGFASDFPADGFFANLGTALRHLWYLIDAAMLPGEPVLSDAWPITTSWGAGESAAMLGAIVLGVTIGVCFVMRHPAALGGSWFLLVLLPGVGAFPTSHYHDAQVLYLAVWGLAFAIGFSILQLWRPVGRQLVPGSEAVAYVPLILVLGVVTALSNARWWDHVGLFEAEVASDPHYMEGRVELAKAALEQGEHEAAINHAFAALEASRDATHTGFWPERDNYLVLGRAQWELGQHADASKSFDAALSAAPNDPDAHYWRGLAALAQHDYANAESHLRAAVAHRAPFPEAEADLGTVLAAQQRYVEALPLLAAAIDAGLGTAPRLQALAAVYIDANRLEDAVRHLEHALALRDDADGRARLAWLYWKLGNNEKAHAALAAAKAADDGGSDYITWVAGQLTPDQTASAPDVDTAPVDTQTPAEP